jgi:hypothetical protein
VLDWCATAVDAGTECRLQAVNSLSKMVELEDAVKDLKAQLEELIAAKEEDETAMLYKFRDLLNEKKLKIREQQRAIDSQLLGQRASSATADMSPAPPPPTTKKNAGASRPTKRKAQSYAATGDTPDSDGTEAMDIDKVKEEEKENDDDETGGETQTESVASTYGDSEDGNDVASRSHASVFNKPAQEEPPAPAGKKAAAQPPPKRSLPFAKSKPRAAAAQTKKGAESETDSDDEL